MPVLLRQLHIVPPTVAGVMHAGRQGQFVLRRRTDDCSCTARLRYGWVFGGIQATSPGGPR